MECDQFDATLGGTEQLPHSINSLKFATARSMEIAAMTESILRPSVTKLIFQTLPVHMRRRVMSHNSKRLPRKFREGHMEQLKKSGLPPKQKRPSRKYRRRAGNLLDEYNRRKKSNIWLETHIWHAKRFHMIKRWGHKIAYAPCDKAFRACYRASSAHCLLQDISYYIPIQIKGDIDTIKIQFRSITNPACNLGICSKAYISGRREGNIHLFKTSSFPFGYIGKINYLWEPGEGSLRTLWLFVHPSMEHEVKLLFNETFDEPLNNDIPEKRRKLSSFNKKHVELKYINNTFNIFRLTGPNSHAILCKSLKCIDSIEKIKTNDWVARHFANSASELRLEDKAKYWRTLHSASSPSQLPAKIVIGLVVRDPRLSRPTYRTKAYKDSFEIIDTQALISIPEAAARSPLWNLSIHESIKEKRLTNHQFIEKITKTQIIPGEIYEDDPELQSVPVVIVQRTGSQDSEYKKLGYGSGWDIIVPSGYGLPFWLTFVMFGARAGGLRETENLAFESGEQYLPPDSKAGLEEEIRIEQELKNRYFSLPPSKRVNYIKLGINSPFRCPWKILLSDWSQSNFTDFYVLRDKQVLLQIHKCVLKKCNLPPLENAESCLIPVYVQVAQKGNLKQHALICLPIPGDMNSVSTLFEMQHTDNNEKVRKLLRKEHRVTIKKLRRKINKNKLEVKQCNGSAKIVNKSNQEPSDYVKKIRELTLPSTTVSVRNTCSRELLGYISKGAFSFSQAHNCGIGYIPYYALNTLLQTGQNNVLVRNICSRKYRLANIQIINS